KRRLYAHAQAGGGSGSFLRSSWVPPLQESEPEPEPEAAYGASAVVPWAPGTFHHCFLLLSTLLGSYLEPRAQQAQFAFAADAQGMGAGAAAAVEDAVPAQEAGLFFVPMMLVLFLLTIFIHGVSGSAVLASIVLHMVCKNFCYPILAVA